MLEKFRTYFKANINHTLKFFNYQSANLINLGRFVSAFKISSKIFPIAEKVKDLAGISSPIKINDIANELKMPTEMAEDYKNLLEYVVISYINLSLSENNSLTKLMHKLNFFIEDKAKVITWLNELNQIDN